HRFKACIVSMDSNHSSRYTKSNKPTNQIHPTHIAQNFFHHHDTKQNKTFTKAEDIQTGKKEVDSDY
ncbi:MAG: hypothetical protein LBQ66_05925, partial [Planctomycetaceae bacterium]|nr:hypothetical protein [Planctomycetaceae bacterium]